MGNKDQKSCDKKHNAAKKKKKQAKENALNQERDQIEADVAAGKKPKSPNNLMCPCVPPGPALVGVSIECGSQNSPGFDGDRTTYLWVSFQLPGQNARTTIAVEIVPNLCKNKDANGKQVGDTAADVAQKVAAGIKKQTNKEQQGSIFVGSRFFPPTKPGPKAKGKDLLIIAFDSVCCVDVGSEDGKIRPFVFRDRDKNGKAAVQISPPPSPSKGGEDKKTRKGQYKWFFHDGPWSRWLSVRPDSRPTAGRDCRDVARSDRSTGEQRLSQSSVGRWRLSAPSKGRVPCSILQSARAGAFARGSAEARGRERYLGLGHGADRWSWRLGSCNLHFGRRLLRRPTPFPLDACGR